MPYLYFDLGAAVLCASFMSFGVKRRWFSLAAALHLALSTYVSYVGGQVHYGDWLKVRTYSLISSVHFCIVKSNINVRSNNCALLWKSFCRFASLYSFLNNNKNISNWLLDVH